VGPNAREQNAARRQKARLARQIWAIAFENRLAESTSSSMRSRAFSQIVQETFVPTHFTFFVKWVGNHALNPTVTLKNALTRRISFKIAPSLYGFFADN